jgi:hypothetical protein
VIENMKSALMPAALPGCLSSAISSSADVDVQTQSDVGYAAGSGHSQGDALPEIIIRDGLAPPSFSGHNRLGLSSLS